MGARRGRQRIVDRSAALHFARACAESRSDAIEVILDGADEGEVDKSPPLPGKISFCRSLPLSKARTDVLLAYEMNGEKLSP